MKLPDILVSACVETDLKADEKQAVIEELCQKLAQAGKLPDPSAIIKTLMDREALGSTGIGQGVAIPHAKSASVPAQVAAVGLSRKGIDFDALDGEPVHIVFLLVAPSDAAGEHLKALAKISRLLKDKFFRQSLREARTSEDVLRLIQEEDEH